VIPIFFALPVPGLDSAGRLARCPPETAVTHRMDGAAYLAALHLQRPKETVTQPRTTSFLW